MRKRHLGWRDNVAVRWRHSGRGSNSWGRWVVEDRAKRQSFWAGLLLAPIVIIGLLPLGQDGVLAFFVGYVLLVATIVGRRNRAMGWGFFGGSSIGGFATLLVGTPLLFFGMRFESFEPEPPVEGPDGLDVTYFGGHNPHAINGAYQIANDTDSTVIIRAGADSETVVTSHRTAVIHLQDCHDTVLSAVNAKGELLDERPTFCPGEIWHVGPKPRTTKPEARRSRRPRSSASLVTYVDPEYLETNSDVFLIVNATDRPIQVRDGNGWRLAKVPADRAAVVTANGCENVPLSATWSNGNVFAEQPELCSGSTWLLLRQNESSLIVGDDH